MQQSLQESADGVILVVTRKVLPGNESFYDDWLGRIAQAELAAPGFLNREDIPPLPDGQDWYTSVIRFDTAANLDAWMESSTCRDLVAEVEPLCFSVAKSRIAPGFSGWFSEAPATGGPPPAWKMTMGVVLALYPSIFLISWLLTSRVDWNFPVKLLVSNIVAVSCVSWISMPLVRRLLGRWMGPTAAVSPTVNIVGVLAIVIALLAMLWLFLQIPMG